MIKTKIKIKWDREVTEVAKVIDPGNPKVDPAAVQARRPPAAVVATVLIARKTQVGVFHYYWATNLKEPERKTKKMTSNRVMMMSTG